MTAELRGGLRANGLRIGIAVARFNEFVTYRLLEGARTALAQHGVEDTDVTVVWVPGSFELPLIARKLSVSGRFDAVICLGAVIRGETDHYEHVARAAASGIARVGAEAGIPVIFGVLTTDTVEQALARADSDYDAYARDANAGEDVKTAEKPTQGKRENAGYNAVVSAIEMANLLRELDAG